MKITNLFKSKKADERYLSIWMFFIWIIIAVGIIYGFALFFSIKADVRPIESGILAVRILDCISDDFNYNEISKADFDLYARCGLNKNYIEKSALYYINLSIKDSSGAVLKNFQTGDSGFAVQCNYQSENNKVELNFAQCSSKLLHAIDASTNKEYLLNILAASNQK